MSIIIYGMENISLSDLALELEFFGPVFSVQFINGAWYVNYKYSFDTELFKANWDNKFLRGHRITVVEKNTLKVVLKFNYIR